MQCIDCEYIEEELCNKLEHYNKIVKNEGIPNDTYGHWTYDDAKYSLLESCWCEKIGGKIIHYGGCDEDYHHNDTKKYRSNKKKRNKRERDLKYKNHLKYLAENIPGYPSPVYPVDKNGNYYSTDLEWLMWFPECVDQEFAYYKRVYRSSGKKSASNYHKKMSNRKIRRYKGEISNGWNCHKIYDYWWEMY